METISLGLAIWYLRHADPVTEEEARELVEAHNRRVQLTPYAGAAGGGLAIGGAF